LSQKCQQNVFSKADFIHGKAGVDAVRSVLGKVTGNKKLFETSTRNYATPLDVCKPRNFQLKEGNELFVGREKNLLGVLWLQEKLRDNNPYALSSALQYRLVTDSNQKLLWPRTDLNDLFVWKDNNFEGVKNSSGVLHFIEVLSRNLGVEKMEIKQQLLALLHLYYIINKLIGVSFLGSKLICFRWKL
ncbi:unnamed protein product, partial [Allacma fusca]